VSGDFGFFVWPELRLCMQSKQTRRQGLDAGIVPGRPEGTPLQKIAEHRRDLGGRREERRAD
jgi:hypothetical protein